MIIQVMCQGSGDREFYSCNKCGTFHTSISKVEAHLQICGNTDQTQVDVMKMENENLLVDSTRLCDNFPVDDVIINEETLRKQATVVEFPKVSIVPPDRLTESNVLPDLIVEPDPTPSTKLEYEDIIPSRIYNFQIGIDLSSTSEPEREPVSDKLFPCLKCGEACESQFYLTFHHFCTKFRYRCPKCRVKLSSLGYLNAHIDRNSCIAPPTSTEIITNKEANASLVQTVGQQTSSEGNSKSNLTCNRCLFTFKTKDTFKSHQRRKRDCNPVPKFLNPSKRLFACTYPGCRRIFPLRRSQTVHIKSHNTEKPYSCSHCGQRFKNAKNWTIHSHSCKANRTSVVNGEETEIENLETMGIGDREKQPSSTPQNLENRDNRTTALTDTNGTTISGFNASNVINIYTCHICHKVCRSYTFYLRHVAAHSNIRGDDIDLHCVNCGREYKNITALSVHTLNKSCLSYNFQCLHCGIKFKSDAALKRHTQVVHPEVFERERTCQICGEVFKYRHSVEKHMLKYHKKFLIAEKSDNVKADVIYID